MGNLLGNLSISSISQWWQTLWWDRKLSPDNIPGKLYVLEEVRWWYCMCSPRGQSGWHADTHWLDAQKYPVHMQTGDRCTHLGFEYKITCQQDGSLSICTYRKPAHTDQFLHFSSHHPRAHKPSVVTILLRRVFRHCSTKEEWKGKLAQVHNALMRNIYLCWLIDSRLLESKRRAETRKSNPDSLSSIPYIQGVLEAISRVLAEFDIHAYFKPANTIRSMVSHPKDRVLLLNKSGVVYEVECDCCNALYVGETKRTLESRLDEHWKAVQRGEVNASALVEHAWNASHHVNWDSTEILGVSSWFYSRLALEEIHIRRQKNSLNCDRGKLGIVHVYDSIWDGQKEGVNWTCRMCCLFFFLFIF